MAKLNSWFGLAKKARKNLYYALVLVGGERGKDRFFILAQDESNGLISDYQARHPKQKKNGGFDWAAPHPFENAWPKLPGWHCRRT